MAKSSNPVEMVFNRIAHEHPAPALIQGYEIDEWPEGAIKTFTERGLLIQTRQARSVVCIGCESACHKPVILRREPGASDPSAFVVCDEAEGLGRIPVRLSRLDQFEGSLKSAATFAASVLELERPGPIQTDRVPLGRKRGRYGLRDVALAIKEKRVVLRIGQQERSLVDLMPWREQELAPDYKLLQRLANRKDRQPRQADAHHLLATSAGSTRRQLIVERDALIVKHGRRLSGRGKTLVQISEEIADMSFIRSLKPGLRPITPARIRRILTEKRRCGLW
jgi:hypothetical protein